jgi:hypothetical protein
VTILNCAPPRRAGFSVEARREGKDLEWQDSCMLPGFRILFALVVLSVAILIFGFGALALLRTAHENFASQPTWQPTWRTPIEVANASRNDRQGLQSHTLALLRVDPPPREPSSTPPVASGPDTGVAVNAPVAPGAPTNRAPFQEAKADSSATEISNDAAQAQVSATTSSDAATDDAAKAVTAHETASPAMQGGVALDKPTDQPAESGALATEPPKPLLADTARAVNDDAAATASPAEAAPLNAAPRRSSDADKADSASPTREIAPIVDEPVKVAALPDAAASSTEAQQPVAKPAAKSAQPDAAELRAKRRARARLRARRLAAARARAARLAQVNQQATTATMFNDTTIPSSSVARPPNNTPFGAPRGAP